jgi:Right handed beta helix region
MWAILALLLLLRPGLSVAAEFYVDKNGVEGFGCSDSNPGTKQSPRCTIAAGRALLNASGGGNTLWIRAGTYGESLQVSKANPLPSGSSWASATVVAGYGMETVFINGGQGIQIIGQNTASEEQLFQYIIFKNFKIQGGTEGIGAQGCNFSGTAPRMECGAHFIRWDTIERFNFGGPGDCHSGAGGGFGATDLQYVNVTIHDGGGSGCAGPPGHGFYVAAERMLLDNVHVYNMTGYGIQIFDSGCPTEPDDTRNCGKDTIIRNSSFHHNGSQGLGGIIVGHGSNVKIYNNIIYNNHINNLELGYASTKNTEVYNNTVYGADIGCGICIATAAPNAIVKNNILMNNPTPIQLNSNTSYTLEKNLCTADKAGFPGCELIGDPAFSNAGAGDFTLQAGSAARNQGVTLALFNTDRASVTRPQGPAWDIGAYEYPEGGGPAFDFLVPSPGTKTLPQGSSITFPVTATYNGGTAEPVSWSVSGLPSGVTYSFTGSPCTPTCTPQLTLTATGAAPIGSYNTPLLAAQTVGGLVRDTNFTIQVTAPTAVFDFGLATPGNQTLAQGAAITVPITVSLVSGTAAPVTLSVTAGLPAGVTSTFTSNPCTPPCTAQLILTASPVASVGTATLTVHGAGGTQTHDMTFDLTVTNVLSTANPIYVRKTVGSPSNSCIAAEQATSAKQSIGDACQCMTVPGKVMLIEGNGNTYIEQIDTGSGCPLTGGNGPSFTTATRIEGYGSPLPVIQAPVGANMALWLRASTENKYLIIKKLVFDAANHSPNAIAVFPTAHHVRFEEVEAKNTVGGFEPFYLTGASDITLVDTFLHDAGSHALTLDASVSNFLCQRCHLFNAGQKGVNVNSTGTKTGLTFEATEVRNNTGTGVDIGASTGTVLQNMLIHSNGGTGGVQIRTGASGTRALNNTIYGNTGVGLQCDSGASTAELKNNIVYGNTVGNIVNNCGATIAKNLCAVSSADCPVFGNPLFVSAPSDLHLGDGSPGINAGETISSITTDYSGNPRQQDGQDIGAYERTQTPPVNPDTTERPRNIAWTGWFF